MSIGKRLLDLARAELNSLLYRAAEGAHEGPTPHDADEDLYRRFSLDELTDKELEAELERRHQARKVGGSGKAASQAAGPTASESAQRTHASGSPPSSRPSPAERELRAAYAALEVPPGSDFETVRASYRALMRKYHPDRHADSPEKQKAATEVAQKLTQAYELLQHDRGRGRP